MLTSSYDETYNKAQYIMYIYFKAVFFKMF